MTATTQTVGQPPSLPRCATGVAGPNGTLGERARQALGPAAGPAGVDE